jgi:steroid delta-isomerase-like uncharacterized protein
MADTERTNDRRSAGDLMRAVFAALTKRDLEALASMWHEEVVEDFVVLGVFRGRAAARAFFAELFAAVPDLEFQTERILEAGGSIAVGQWKIRGTFSGGPFQGIEPTGRRVELRGVDVMEFEDGLLRRNTIYYDGLSFARQIGLLPVLGSVADRAVMTTFNAVTRVRRRVGAAVRSRRGRS